jgi:hypothetical protein
MMRIEETQPAGAPLDSPVASDAPTEDRVGTAAYAMATAASTAVTWFAILTLVQSHLLQSSTARDVSQVDPHSFAVNFLVYGALTGIAFSGGVAWFLMSAIPSSYRRGGLAMAGALAGTVPAGVLTTVARMLGGPPLLVLLGALAGLATFWLGRRAVLSAR